MMLKKISALLLCLAMLLTTCVAGAEFTLPQDLTIIAEEAFYGDASLNGTVEIPAGVIEIGARAFANCENVTQIILPPSVEVIGEDAFHGCEDAEFVVYAGSYAQTWCDEMGIVSTLYPAETKGDIRIWVPEALVDFISEKVAEFTAEYADSYAGYSLKIEAVGEGDAAMNLINDWQAGADIFIIAQDYVERLAKAGALTKLFEYGNAGSVAKSGARVDGTYYAFPLTLDNGYFMYYDKSVITDPTSLEQIIADCEAAGKTVNYEINSGWYGAAFFFANGCSIDYNIDAYGSFSSCTIDIASAKGVKALRSMIDLAKSSAFENNSTAYSVHDLGMIVDGSWDGNAIRQILGENFGVAKMPKANGSQLKCFSGGKYVGVKTQESQERQALIMELAAYLSCADMQKELYNRFGWLPADQDAHGVVTSSAFWALVDQVTEASVIQRPFPGEYWSIMTAFIDNVIAGNYDDYTDDQLLLELQMVQEMLISYAR